MLDTAPGTGDPEDTVMKKALSPEEALAEVKSYTGLSPSADDIRSLYEILTVPRNDTAILSHLRAAHHVLGNLPHLQDGENWWDKVHTDVLAADDPYIDQSSGSHKKPAPNDRNAVIFWLKRRILPALTGEDSTGVISNGMPGTGEQDQHQGAGKSGSGKSGSSGQGPLADAKKRRALENYAMAAATRYYEKQWVVEDVSHTKKVLDIRLVHRVSGQVRHVEVKGSSQEASIVEVTKAEVSKSRKGACELFVFDKVAYQDTGPGPDDYTCRGGRLRVGKWRAEDKDLTPKTYDYHLGADFGKDDTVA